MERSERFAWTSIGKAQAIEPFRDTLGDKIPMYAGWNALLAASPTEAKVFHFGGPVAPNVLRIKEFVLGTTPERLSITFATPRELMNLSNSKLSQALLSIDALPDSVKPMAVIDWPVEENSPALQTSHVLPQRCCYWEFYTETFQIPKRAVPGKATITIIVPPDKFPLELSSDHFEVPVIRKQ